MKFLIAIIFVIVFMALRDFLGTQLVVFESRGDGENAGRMDGLGDVASMLYTLIGIDALNKYGFSIQGIIMMVAIAFTSYKTTKWATNRMFKNENSKN